MCCPRRSFLEGVGLLKGGTRVVPTRWQKGGAAVVLSASCRDVVAIVLGTECAGEMPAAMRKATGSRRPCCDAIRKYPCQSGADLFFAVRLPSWAGALGRLSQLHLVDFSVESAPADAEFFSSGSYIAIGGCEGLGD